MRGFGAKHIEYIVNNKTNKGVEYSNYSTEFIGIRRTQWTWLSHALSTVLYITLNKENPYTLLPPIYLSIVPLPQSFIGKSLGSPGRNDRHWNNKVRRCVWRSCFQGGTSVWFRFIYIYYKHTPLSSLREKNKTLACVWDWYGQYKITAWTTTVEDNRKKDIHKESWNPWKLAVSLWKGHFFVCLCLSSSFCTHCFTNYNIVEMFIYCGYSKWCLSVIFHTNVIAIYIVQFML